MLDAALIRDRRMELGLSKPALARALNVSAATIRGLEAGSNHREQTLATIEQLAETFALPVSSLLSKPGDPPVPTADDVRIEATLSAVGQGTSAKDLAVALEWPAPRVAGALADLRQRLSVTGQRLYHHAGKYRLVYARDQISDEELQRAERGRVATNRLTKSEARALLALIQSEITPTWLKHSTPERHITAHRLRRLGYAEENNGGLQASEEVLLGLGMRR